MEVVALNTGGQGVSIFCQEQDQLIVLVMGSRAITKETQKEQLMFDLYPRGVVDV